jgi:hypothetical protein
VRLGQTEVEHLDLALFRQLDVRRLQVAVDDTGLVGGGEAFGDLGGDAERFGDRQRAAGDALRQVLAADQLHRDEADAVGLVQAVDGGDVRVVEGRQQPGLALEARQPAGVGGKLCGEHFDRRVTIEGGVGRPPDDAHAAFTDLFDQAVVQQLLSGSEGHASVSPRDATTEFTLGPRDFIPLRRSYA